MHWSEKDRKEKKMWFRNEFSGYERSALINRVSIMFDVHGQLISALLVSLKCHKGQKRQLEKVLHPTEKAKKIRIISALRNN